MKFFLASSQFGQFVNLVNNLVSYSDECSTRDQQETRIFSNHNRVLELSLRESFLRANEVDLLSNLFAEENIDNLFGQGTHASSEEGNES